VRDRPNFLTFCWMMLRRHWLLFVIGFLIGFAPGAVIWISRTTAAPLKVQASYLSAYYSRTVETLVTVNLKANRAGTATLTARGLQLPNYAGGQRDDEYQATVKLHKGHNHFRRRFFVARWTYAIPGYGAALHPYHDRLVAEDLNAVSVELTVGGRVVQTRYEVVGG
jgi:hypothetical protein